MSEQDGTEAPALQRPTTNDPDAWKTYWRAQGWPWRTEPEIDTDRQKYLAERRAIKPDIEQGTYAFKDIKLSRGDVEWLLVTHENGRGPVDWSDENQRNRNGIDLRGADLRQEDLRNIPLARMRGGFARKEWQSAIPEQRSAAGVHLEGADLRQTHLEGAILIRAHLEKGAFREAYLERADFRSSYLERATFQEAHLEQANFQWAHLDRVSFVEAHLAGTDFRGARLEGANFFGAHLEGVLKLQKNIYVELLPADLRGAFFDPVSNLDKVTLGEKRFGFVSVADVHWGEVNLAVVNWTVVDMLGDEFKARQKKEDDGKEKLKEEQVNKYLEAVRANRQLSVALQGQGLNEEAARFAYRAQMLQRKVFRYQGKFGSYLFSLLLALLSGYGYRIWRILAAYIVMVSLFALAYFVLGMHYAPHLPLAQAYLESITAFHGRVFLEQFSVNTPQIWLTALEAIVGLIIEGVFIAMLIQRFFGK